MRILNKLLNFWTGYNAELDNNTETEQWQLFTCSIKEALECDTDHYTQLKLYTVFLFNFVQLNFIF